MTEPQAPSCTPGHTNVTELAMNMLQKSDGTAQFTCNICGIAVVKLMATELDFVKKYKRHHQLCVDHVRDREYIPTSKDDDGDLSCNWCGEKLPELPAVAGGSPKLETIADDSAVISALANMTQNITNLSQISVKLLRDANMNQMLGRFFKHHITEEFTDPAVDYLQLGKSFTGLGLVMTYLGSMFLTVDRERTEAKVKTETASYSEGSSSGATSSTTAPTATSPAILAPIFLPRFDCWIQLPETVNGWDGERAHSFIQQLSSSLHSRNAGHVPYQTRFGFTNVPKPQGGKGKVFPIVQLRFRSADAVRHCGKILKKPYKFGDQDMEFIMHEDGTTSSHEITEPMAAPSTEPSTASAPAASLVPSE